MCGVNYLIRKVLLDLLEGQGKAAIELLTNRRLAVCLFHPQYVSGYQNTHSKFAVPDRWSVAGLRLIVAALPLH